MSERLPGTNVSTVGSKQTYVYKTVGGCEIKADVYQLREHADRVVSSPVVVYIHGGALMVCNRYHCIPGDQIDMYLRSGYVVVAIDYRLAPEAKLPEIMDDIRDAFRWVRKEGPSLFNADPERIAVHGRSAGGYLTQMTGFIVDPRPKVLVSVYGYCDITAPWYSEPDRFYRETEPLVSESKARAGVGGRVISETLPGQRDRFALYIYCRQNGLWPNEVSGHDFQKEPRWFDPYRPIANITRSYPPTLLIHGDADTDVPYGQSVMMADELARVGVEHEFITVPGRGHELDNAGINDPVVADLLQRELTFVKKYL